jgi:hypothetical protein
MAEAGRPSKYRPEMCKILVDVMSQGYSMTAACSDMGITKVTCLEWVKNIPEFAEAYEKGKEACQKFWESLLVQAATGLMSDELKKKKSKGINMTAVIFALKTRFHKDFGEQQKQLIEFQNLPNMSDEQLKAIIESAARLASDKSQNT